MKFERFEMGPFSVVKLSHREIVRLVKEELCRHRKNLEAQLVVQIEGPFGEMTVRGYSEDGPETSGFIMEFRDGREDGSTEL